ncbi:MAG: hypothetical protein JO147_02190 [Actinobacteria bacterium]|nr:hypothetical protein [Actinomycetota bacterium]
MRNVMAALNNQGPASRPAISRLNAALSLIALLTITILVALAVLWPWNVPGDLILLNILSIIGPVSFIGCGILAWSRRPSSGVGALMIFAGWTFIIGDLGGVESTPLIAISDALGVIGVAAITHLLLGFPSGRLRSTAARWTVAAAYFVALVLQIPVYTLSETGTPLTIAVRPSLETIFGHLQSWSALLVFIVAGIIAFRRWRQTERKKRRILGPLYIYTIVSLMFLPFWHLFIAGPAVDPLDVADAEFADMSLVPVLFLVAMLRGGFARTTAIEDLARRLGAEASSPEQLRTALVNTLGDPTIELLYWSAEREIYVDAAGYPATIETFEGMGLQEIHVGSRLVGAFTYDATYFPDRSDAESTARLIAVAVDRDRLTAELLANEQTLRRSRSRIANAAQSERRRIAQRLHDEMQGRLVVLALKAQLIAEATNISAEDLQELRAEADATSERLRAIVSDVMPTPLIERGLAAAIDDFVDRIPIPIEVSFDSDIGSTRLPPAIEDLAYFIVAESVTNSLKYGKARSRSVRVRVEADQVLLHIDDDGIGGAGQRVGHGLRSLLDRVDALGGRMTIVSEPNAGTHVAVVLPSLQLEAGLSRPMMSVDTSAWTAARSR